MMVLTYLSHTFVNNLVTVLNPLSPSLFDISKALVIIGGTG